MTDTTAEVVDAVDDRETAVEVATAALRDGRLVVVPTDTVYGVTADAFNPSATAAVFTAKRRQRRFPLPVLIRSPKQLLGLVTSVPETAERLMAAYWPGPLTLVVRTDPNLAWDLGTNEGTVAVRMPLDEVTLDLIRAVGPLATTSANLAGNTAATTVALARAQLGDDVAVYVDAGARVETVPSTIVDLTRSQPAILRSGPLPDDEVLDVARGDLEPHLASPPAPRHKPVSPGGPADVTPDPDRDAAPDASAAAEGPDGIPDQAPADGTVAPVGSAAASAVAVDHRAGGGGSSTSRRRRSDRGVAGRPAPDGTDEAPSRAAPRQDEVEPTPAPARAQPSSPARDDLAGDGADDDPDRAPAAGTEPGPAPTRHVARDHRAGH